MWKSPRIPEPRENNVDEELAPNIHPGEILLEEFLHPLNMSQNALARAISVPPRRINEIVLGKRSITADTDLRLARYFGLSEGFFLRLQNSLTLWRSAAALARRLRASSRVLRRRATRAAGWVEPGPSP